MRRLASATEAVCLDSIPNRVAPKSFEIFNFQYCKEKKRNPYSPKKPVKIRQSCLPLNKHIVLLN